MRLDRDLSDGIDRVVGTLPMVINHTGHGLCHVRVVRSMVPHGRITELDRVDAQQADGVLAVVTGADLADLPIDPWFGEQRKDQPVLAIDRVRYAGEPVALVVAESARQAADAAELVFVDYDELPFVVDAVEAGKDGAPTIHEAWPGNGCGDWRLERGDVDAALAGAHRVYRGTYHTPTASHVPMEPHVAVAEFHDDGTSLDVLTSAQAPHAVRNALRAIFNIDDVTVRVQNLGGGYGAKGQVKIEPMAAVAAFVTGRPVKLELTREEVFATIGRHAGTVQMTTGFDHQGHIVAREVDVVYNAGAYTVTSAGASGQGLIRSPGPYRIPNIRARSRAHYTNTVPTGPFRGAMTSQVCLAYEAQLDEAANDLGIDRLEIRRRNVLHDGDTYATGESMHDMHYDELLDATAAAIDWEIQPASDGSRRRGKGLGVMIKSTITPSRSEARVVVDANGRVRLHSASVEMGQGASATLALLVAEHLGIEATDVDRTFPDTDQAPYDTTTASSRTTFSMGNAVADACRKLRDALDEVACGAPPPSPCEHRNHQVVTPDGPRSYSDVVNAAGRPQVEGHGTFATTGGLGDKDPANVQGRATVHWHQGSAAVEVEVDVETGHVTVLRARGGAYAGRAISHLRVDQQNVGCVVFGLGPALFEEVLYDEGQNTNPNLSDYMIPSILDVPVDIGSVVVEHPDPDAELHGVGEMAVPPLAPAIVSAIHDATGVWLRELPLTPERVLRALDEASDTATGART